MRLLRSNSIYRRAAYMLVLAGMLLCPVSSSRAAEHQSTKCLSAERQSSDALSVGLSHSSDSIVHDTLVIDANGHLSRYDRNVMRYRRRWESLIPTSGVLQFFGNMGVVSTGIGWQYGKHHQWETQLLLGLIPRYSSDAAKLTFTLKENFIPWRTDMGKGWTFQPLECSLYLNTIFGHDFWTKQPTKYESGYYPFSTRIRPNLALGERFKYDIPNNRRKVIKNITFFYELGTNDIYFMRFYRNGSAGFWDVFGLSFGFKVQYL